MVHCHTTWSDGRASLEEMARAAEALGMEYLTVTDPLAHRVVRGGSTRIGSAASGTRSRAQEKVNVRLLRGTESDILEDGALDFSDRVLEQLDVVVASVHSRMKMDEDAMTRRLVRCMSLPVFKIWGHALGRLLLDRPPFACRVEEVRRARGVAWRSRGERRSPPAGARAALAARRDRAQIPVVLSVDAHSVKDLGYLRNAVTVARRGWVRRGQVLNTLGAEEFRRAVRPVG